MDPAPHGRGDDVAAFEPVVPLRHEGALAALDGQDIAAMRGAARDLYERRYSAPRFCAEVRAALQGG